MVEKMKPPVPKEQKMKPPRKAGKEVAKPEAVVKGKGKGKTR